MGAWLEKERGKEVWRRKGVAESSKQGEARNAAIVFDESSEPKSMKTPAKDSEKAYRNLGCINVLSGGNGNLFKSAVARIRKMISAEDLETIFKREGINEVQVKSMGGRFFLVTFPNKQTRDDTITKKWLLNWVDEIKTVGW